MQLLLKNCIFVTLRMDVKSKSMKKLFLYLPFLLLGSSCIMDEPLNAEADILTCVVKNEQGQADINIKGDALVSNTRVMALAIPRINLKKLAPEFTITPGATIEPASGTMLDFSQPQKYTVTSQDGNWEKVYMVSVDTSEITTRYNFELSETPGKYEMFYEEIPTVSGSIKQYIWASGNPGFALTGVASTPKEYPTILVDEGYRGKGLKLVTKSTGKFGETVKMPIAAGNLFIGSFDVGNAMREPLKATLFGLPFGKKPIKFKGRYVYKRGAPFIIKNAAGDKQEAPGREDIGDIYAVLYDAEGGSLNGENVLSSDRIIALARVDNMKVTDANTPVSSDVYEAFEISFDYDSYRGTRPFMEEKSKEYQYNLAVVFTSSRDGAYFAGALGSTLYVDDVEVICE